MSALLVVSAAAGMAYLVSWWLGPALVQRAPRWSLVDRPGGRKNHGDPVPAVGGIAIFVGIVLPAVVLLLLASFLGESGGVEAPGLGAGAVGEGGVLPFGFPDDQGLAVTLLFGAALLHIIGLIDDRSGLGPLPKLVGQAAAILPLVLLHEMVLLPEWLPPFAGVVATTLWCLVVINAFNFLDGLDGLMGCVAILCALQFAGIAALEGEWTTVFLAATLAGAVGGFLVHNFPPARIFAGDNGSLVVGFLLAAISVRVTYYDPGGPPFDTPPHAVLAPLVILSLPFYDFASVLLLRLREGRSPFVGDNSHLAHRLLRRGFTPKQALVFICGCTVATGFGGVLLMHVGTVAAIFVVAQAAIVVFLLALSERPGRRGDSEGSP